MSREETMEYLGYICAIHNYLYYIRYLPQLYIIFRKKDVSGVMPRLLAADTMNSLFWMAYGMILKNTNIIYPSAVGVIVESIFIIMFCLFYTKNISGQDSTQIAALTAMQSQVRRGKITCTCSRQWTTLSSISSHYM